MVFKEGQEVYFLNRIKKKHHNAHMWAVEPAIVVSDEGNNHRVEVKTSDQNIVSIRRRVIFETKDKENAEEKCDYWNHWDRYHKRKHKHKKHK